MDSVAVIFAILGFALALVKPHWGVILFVSALPVESMIPQRLFGSIPFFTSPVSMLGGVVIVGTVLNLIITRRLQVGKVFSSDVQWIGLLFIAWFTITNPADSWFGQDRNYVFTFVQLWSLLWLAATVLQDERHQRQLMVVFAFVCLLSASNSLLAGQVASTREESIRSAGMMSGLNTAARYFVIGVVFLVFLGLRARTQRARWGATAGIIFLLVSVAYTQSRAGIGLALMAVVLLLLVTPRIKRRRSLVYLAAMLILVAVLVPATLWQSIGASFFREESRPRERLQSIDENLRYSLWYAGFRMWLDNPVVGVGMGRFQSELEGYLPISVPGKFYNISSHNMFVRVLAETGIIGLALFAALILFALRRLRRARPPESSSLYHISDIWFVALVVIVLGGLLKDDHTDKLFWLFLGIASSFKWAPALAQKEMESIYFEATHPHGRS